MGGNKMVLSLVLAESSLELVPHKIVSHPSITAHAQRLGKKSCDILLDNSWHFAAMKNIKNEMKRGRPDIVHLAVLEVVTIPLYINNMMRLYVHTINDRVIYFGSNVRIPKSYHRFAGLIEKLYKEKVIVASGDVNNVLLELKTKSFEELIKEIKPSRTIGMSTSGYITGSYIESARRISKIAQDDDNACVVVGGFQKGHFSDMVEKNIDETYCITGGSFEGHVVLARLLYECEKAMGCC